MRTRRAERGAEAATTRVAAVLTLAADGIAAGFPTAELLGAETADWRADAAAMVAAELPRPAGDLIAFFFNAQGQWARLTGGDAGSPAADIAAGGADLAESRGTAAHRGNRLTGTGAIGAARVGKTIVSNVVHAPVAIRTRNARDAAAIAAGDIVANRNVGPGATSTHDAKGQTGHSSENAPARRPGSHRLR